jgi:hypothetical protein
VPSVTSIFSARNALPNTLALIDLSAIATSRVAISSLLIFSFAFNTEQTWLRGAESVAFFNESANAIVNPSVKVVKGYNKKAPPAVKQGGAIERV